MIKQVGSSYVLYSRSGIALGVHRTRRQAEAQETAIQISKARAAGHDVPPAPRHPQGKTKAKAKTTKTRKTTKTTRRER